MLSLKSEVTNPCIENLVETNNFKIFELLISDAETDQRIRNQAMYVAVRVAIREGKTKK